MSENSPIDNNVQEMQKNLDQIQEIMSGFLSMHDTMNLDPFKLSAAYTEWMSAVASNPQKLINESFDFWKNSVELGQQAIQGIISGQLGTVVEADKSDRRFRHEDWNEKPVYSAIKQSYLLTSQWMRNMVTDVEGLDPHTAEKVRFFTERYIDALSPTNFALTNPAVVEKTLETNGGEPGSWSEKHVGRPRRREWPIAHQHDRYRSI